MTTSHTEIAVGSESRHISRARPRPSLKLTDADYIARFKCQSTINEKGCWVHNGCQRVSKGMAPGAPGYIQVSYRCERWAIHRLSYTLHKGPIPEGKVITHSCDYPPCWNPDHLSPKTESENIYEAVNKKRDRNTRRNVCIRGHELAGDNLLITNNGRRRQCRTCQDAYHKSAKYIAWRRAYQRIKRGWSKDDAFNTPPVPAGQRTQRRVIGTHKSDEKESL